MVPTSVESIPLETWDQLWRVLTLQIPFDSNTAIVMRGTSILGLACGVVGSYLLLRKRSLVADALSHAALPGVACGFLLATWIGSAARFGVEPKSLVMLVPGAAVFGILGVMCVHLLTRLPRVKEEAAIGAVLSVFFALGIVLLGVIQRVSGDAAGLSQFIFGQAATMSAVDSTLIAAIAVAVVFVALLTHKELKTLCFDPEFTGSIGWSTFALDALLMAMVTALTVIGLNAVGALLMVALLIVPPAAARFWTDRLGVMIVLSAAIGLLSCHVGTACSAALPKVPTGPAIVVTCGALFVISLVASPRRGVLSTFIQRRSLARTVARQHVLRAMYEHGEIRGSFDQPVRLEDLLTRRSWSPTALKRTIRRALRGDEVRVTSEGGLLLTTAGRDAAARIVRTHRIWEHFLTTQADIAPSHVDRAADDIEHVLSDDLIRNLEQELRATGALAEGAFVPASPHRLTHKGERP